MKESLTDQLIKFFDDVCHNWEYKIGFVVCLKCGIVKNDNNYSDECKGKIKIELKD